MAEHHSETQILRAINIVLQILGGIGLVLITLAGLIELVKRLKDQLLSF